MGDSIVARLSRYQNLCKKYFKNITTVNCGISGDKAEHGLWRAKDLFIPPSIKFIIMQCGTNNLYPNDLYVIAKAILSVDKTFLKRSPDLKIILSVILLRDQNKSKRPNKLTKVNICQSKFYKNT